jgi:hypothetical protein
VAQAPADSSTHQNLPAPVGTPSTNVTPQNPEPVHPEPVPVTPVPSTPTNGTGTTGTTSTGTVTAPVTPTPSTPDVTPTAPTQRASTEDRPDDAPGVKQFHVVYAIPADATDRELDLGDAIKNTVASGNNWLFEQTGYRVHFDTYLGELDIQFVRLPRKDADYMALKGSTKHAAISADLQELITSTDKKLLVYYDGSQDEVCADGPIPQFNATDRTAVIYLRGEIPGYRPCLSTGFAGGPTAAPHYTEYLALHEIFHTLGAVHTGAAHQESFHVADDSCDLMFVGVSPCWDGPRTIDVDRMDYWNPTGSIPNVPSTFNVAASPWVYKP